MSERVLGYLEQAGTVITLFAVVVIVAGFALAGWRYALHLGSFPTLMN